MAVCSVGVLLIVALVLILLVYLFKSIQMRQHQIKIDKKQGIFKEWDVSKNPYQHNSNKHVNMNKIDRDLKVKSHKDAPDKKRKDTDNTTDDDEPIIKKKIKASKSSETVSDAVQSTLPRIHSPVAVIRPGPFELYKTCATTTDVSHPLNRKLWVHVFTFLNKNDINSCMLVSKAWNQWCLANELWDELDVSNKQVTASMLCGIVRRQPLNLNLASTNTTGKQLEWLLKRLPYLEGLDISLNNASTVCALMKVNCSQLKYLNLSWCGAIYDRFMTQLLGPSRTLSTLPSTQPTQSRLHQLKELILTGCDIGDEAASYILSNLTNLQHLNISYCSRVTTAGVDSLSKNTHASKSVFVKIASDGCIFNNEEFIARFRSS